MYYDILIKLYNIFFKYSIIDRTKYIMVNMLIQKYYMCKSVTENIFQPIGTLCNVNVNWYHDTMQR